MNAKQPTWNQRFGARRRAIDRVLLEELERSLPEVKDEQSLDTFTVRMDAWIDDDIRQAVARAFGRPVT